MSSSAEFYSLLFEVSNEIRHRILLFLEDKAMRITEIAKELDLNHPEIRRHITRLRDIGLISRDVEGYYHLTPYGEASIILFQEFEFLSANSLYFENHSLSGIPAQYLKRIGELRKTMSLTNAIDYFRYSDNLLRESKEYVLLLVDQFPINSLPAIVNSIERGVKFKIIETKERILNPDLNALTSSESQALNRTRSTPLTEQKMIDKVPVNLFISENSCVLAFPTRDGEYDFKGFYGTNDSTLNWSKDLFQYYWSGAEYRKSQDKLVPVTRELVSHRVDSLDRIVVEGREKPEIDAQAVQDAVDNYEEVILKGTFNFGASSVRISRSVKVRGEGQENDIPTTVIYKKGWRFPFTEFDSVFNIDGVDSEVSIENIHFTDFNHTCILGVQSKSLSIKSNRITLMTGYGRGMTYGAFGDVVIGVWIRGPEPLSFKGEVTVEDNYIDFARGGAFGGFLTRGGLEQDPEYRPDLFNHEYYMGFGIAVHQVSGVVIFKNNNIRNTNARGIAVTGNLPSAEIQINNNTIESDLFGSYPFSSPEAGAGILAQSAWARALSGFKIEITENTINLDKLNYSGIKVLGPLIDREGAGKLRGGTISNNRIQLKEGYEGIHVRKCDDFDVTDNTISGQAYYGIRVSGRESSKEPNQIAMNNMFKDNGLDELQIREPDSYSNNNADGRKFAIASGSSVTAHVWLNKHTKNNEIIVRDKEKVIDEGEDNIIEKK